MDIESNITEITTAADSGITPRKGFQGKYLAPPYQKKQLYSAGRVLSPGFRNCARNSCCRQRPVPFALLRGAAIVYGIALFLYSHVKKDTGVHNSLLPSLFSLFICIFNHGNASGSCFRRHRQCYQRSLLPFLLLSLCTYCFHCPTPIVFAASALSSSIYAFSMIYLYYGFSRDTVYIVLLLAVSIPQLLSFLWSFQETKIPVSRLQGDTGTIFNTLGEITKRTG
jgi:hypothetical protein